MSKPKFMLLIIMMSLSMVGIIWVQAVWIRNAYAISNENFNNAVVSCLNSAAEHIMSSQRMNYFNSSFSSGMGYRGSMSIQSYSSTDSNGMSMRIENQTYSGFVDAGEYSNEDIDNALRQTFAYAGIETPYEFAVIKNGKVQEGSFKKADKLDFFKSRYMVRLFPTNIISQDVILSVVFPARANYVFGQVMWLLGGSLAFSLFIVATFGLSLFFIIRQKKISEMKSDFLNNMTHEFKTPIATISLAADTISNPKVIKDEAKIIHFINMIKKENSRMNKKVETILQTASLDKKEIEFKFENISMHSIIDHVVETMEIQIQRKNGRITKTYDAANYFVDGDQEHLSNLVNNLLDNAVKYSIVNPEITIKTKNVGDGFVFSVEDNGIGMTKAVQGKIFERFYRQPSGNIHNVKGFGLGLHYVRTIVEAHKGTINVTSEPGKGSRFELFLPLNTEN